MTDDIEHELRDATKGTFLSPDGYVCLISVETVTDAADTIANLRADLRAALTILQELVNYDNGGSGDGGAILEAAEQILASHKENTPVQSHEEKHV